MPPKSQPQALGQIKKSSGNSLAGFKTTTSPAPDLAAPRPKRAAPKGRAGRPPKPKAQKESATLILKMTEAEKQLLLDKAGITPLSTWFKHFLKTQTDIFEK